ncbi:MAG: hypothetical protein U0T02_12145 [Solirubrobacteraceae bacterium]
MLSGAGPPLLVALAMLAGLTGTWSPCGFSMIETLRPGGRAGGRRAAVLACAAFALGALAGGALLFGTLGSLGSLARSVSPGAATALAAAVAALAAVAEVLGVRIRPQVRRQVPEPWRRRLPLALAAALYGALLGLGFATFVLTLAVPALAFVTLALGDPALGLALGAAFGAGRALPVALVAPVADRPLGLAITEAMAERPLLLRGLRAADGLLLAACALALAASPAEAARTRRVAVGATDPTASGRALAWQAPGHGAVVRGVRAAGRRPRGSDPALAPGLLALRRGSRVIVRRTRGRRIVFDRVVPGARKLALSRRWLVLRVARRRGRELLLARHLRRGARFRVVAAARRRGALGRPSLDGDRLAFHVAGARGSALRLVNLRTGRRRTLRSSPSTQYLNPSIGYHRVLYVVVTHCSQRLRVAPLGRRGRTRTLLAIGSTARRDAGHDRGHTGQGSAPGRCPHRSPPPTSLMLWTTAIARRFAYVTLLRPRRDGTVRTTLVRLRR